PAVLPVEPRIKRRGGGLCVRRPDLSGCSIAYRPRSGAGAGGGGGGGSAGHDWLARITRPSGQVIVAGGAGGGGGGAITCGGASGVGLCLKSTVAPAQK